MKGLFTRVNLRHLAGYLLAIVATIAILVGAQRLWRADLSVPFAYVGDAVATQIFVKSVIDNGWYLHNDQLGMPWGYDLRDYPIPESLHYGAMKLLASVSANHAVVFNLYYLLTYPLTAVLSLLVFRRFGLSYGLALAGSLLFSFLPYHFWRGEVHLTLAAYYLVPLVVLVLLWLCSGRTVFFHEDEQRQRPSLHLLNLHALAAFVICVLMGSGGVYYAFFGCFLLAVAGGFSYLSQRQAAALWNAGCCIAIIAFVVLLHLAPTFYYRWQHGPNPQALLRAAADPEVYALKIVQLFLPASAHRLFWFAQWKAEYNMLFAANENDSASLGLLGSIGFLILIGRLLYRRPWPGGPRLHDSLSVLNAFAVLLATMGGFGSLLSLAIGPNIRGYNRISVYIAFLSIFALLLVLEKLRRRLALSRLGGLGNYALPLVVLVVGLLDQTSRRQVPRYALVKQEYRNDAEFVKRIEAALPPKAMVFQLPYAPFPEGPCIHQAIVYDQARAYLHSKTLRWSYGGMRGREADLWQQRIAALPPEGFLEEIGRMGFEGLYVDRNAYPDHAASLEAQLAHLLHTLPLVSANQRLAFFDLRYYSQSRMLSIRPCVILRH